MKICLLDMDGTIAREKSPWRYVYERIGLWETTGVPILEKYLSGKITYREFCELDIEAWQRHGIGPAEVRAFLDEIEPFPEAAPLVEYIRDAPDVTAVILSAGFDYVSRRILGMLGVRDTPLGFDEISARIPGGERNVEPGWIGIIANCFAPPAGEGDDFLLQLRISPGGDSAVGKNGWAVMLAGECGITAKQKIFAVGDGVSDEEMFMAAGNWMRIEQPSDLTEFLELLRNG